VIIAAGIITCDVLTDDLEITLSTPHGVRVNLAHVPAPVSLVYVLYV